MRKKIELISFLTLLTLSLTILGKDSNAEDNMQNTPAFHNVNGELNQTIYSKEEMNALETIAAGDDNFIGNSSFHLISEKNIYGLDEGQYYSNVIGNDGVLKLYNKSDFMTTERVKLAAEYWNNLAGTEIVRVVSRINESDQVVYDAPDPGFFGEDGKPVKPLGGETYHNGIVFYPENWQTDDDLQKMATLIHEIGHGLGIPHLGGGKDGMNATNRYNTSCEQEDYPKHEFMTVWFPSNNPDGIISTKEDAAALALAGLTYRNPQKLASWVLKNSSATVSYTKDKKIISTIPFGLEIYFTGNYLTTIATANTLATIDKNYNVYQADDSVILNKKIEKAKQIGTTSSNDLINQKVTITKTYTSNNNLRYYSFSYKDQKYIVDGSAFSSTISKQGMEIDFKGNNITKYEPISKILVMKNNYNLSTFEDVTLENTFIDRSLATGTSDSNQLIGKNIEAIAYYTSNNNLHYYGFYYNENYYVVNEKAFS